MERETLLTRLEVTPKGELYAGFRNLGGVYFPNWKHLFVTKMLGRNRDKGKEKEKRDKRYSKVLDELMSHSNPEISNIKNRRFKDKYWWVQQVYCPISCKDELPEEFIKGHYTKQARWRLTVPGNYIELDEELVRILRKKKELERKNPDSIKLEEINSQFQNSNLEWFKPRKNDKSPTLRVTQKDWKYLSKGRMINGNELANKKWMCLDIEIPYWRRENPEISWVGVSYINPEGVKREIHTLHNLSLNELEGFKILRYNNETDLINNLRDRINEENPDVVSAYNSRFDFIKLRESDAGFEIGENKSNPLFKVTTKFFERIGVKDRFVIDPMRWAKIARAFDINAKLEMTAGFEKSINYDKLEENEDKCFNGDIKAARESASYLASDINHMTRISTSKEFRNSLEDVCWLSKEYSVAFDRLLHSAKCINEFQERGYFEALGIYRDAVPPNFRTKKMQALKTRAKETLKKHLFEKSLKFEEKKGLFNDIYKCYIPYGDFFRDLVVERFPESIRLFEYRDQHRKDKKRLFFLEQFTNAFSEWIREDYGFYLGEVKKLDKMLKEVEIEEFEDAYHDFRDNLEKSSEWGIKHLNEGKLSVKAIEKHSTPDLETFLEDNGFEFSDFQNMANQRSIIKRRGNNILGNYSVYPTVKRFYREKRKLPIIDETIETRVKEIKDFIKNNKIEVISQEGGYIYVSGDKTVLERVDAPIIMVDEIPRLWNSDNPYYEKYGFFSHMKTNEDPGYHLNIFEMGTYRKILESLLEGRFEEARQTYEESLKKLENQWVPKQELIFYNKSEEEYFAYTLDSSEKNGKKYFSEIPEQISLDMDKYISRFKDRSHAILGIPESKKPKKIKNQEKSSQLNLAFN